MRLEEQGISYNEEEYPEIDGNFYFMAGNQTTVESNTTKEFGANVPEPNEKGERVVTVYSTTDTNDLTGNTPTVPDLPMGDLNNQDTVEDKPNEEFQKHVEICNDFLLGILAETGLPAFQFLDPTMQPVQSKPYKRFDPIKHISTPMLNKITPTLLYQNGEAFHTSIQEIELNSIASDGMHNDDVTNGGGHYKTVLQLKTFLEGFRSTEARRESRELIQMMLESLVRDGVNELDMVLSKSLKEGVLNDNLLGFLNEMIVKQERRIRNYKTEEKSEVLDVMEEEGGDVTMVKGEFVEETIDLDAFSKEYNHTMSHIIPQAQHKNGPEQLLSLLKYLRERLKVEAAYRSNTERGHCLKILSYCLHTKSTPERELLIWNAFGKNLEQMEEFCSLVKSSMEYAESTSMELMPGKQSLFLDGKELEGIYELASGLKKKQIQKAGSGAWR